MRCSLTPDLDRKSLLAAVDILADSLDQDLSEEEQAQRLIDIGFPEPVAFRLVAFVAIAFSRPLLERLGVIEFADTISVPTEDSDAFDVRLDDQPEYVAALKLARDHFQSGLIERGAYRRLAGSSSGVEAANRALEAGADIRGSAIAHALVSPVHSGYVLRSRHFPGEEDQ